MTEFVLEFRSKCASMEHYIDAIENYANFLKQPLTLEMFVPVDEVGNNLKNPHARDEDAGTEKEYEQIQFNNALEKVLFEGFYYKSNIDRDGKKWEYVRNEFPHVFSFDQLKNNTVETLLTRFKEEYLIELTPSALK